MTVNVETLPALSTEGDNVNTLHKYARHTDRLLNSMEIPRDVTLSKVKKGQHRGKLCCAYDRLYNVHKHVAELNIAVKAFLLWVDAEVRHLGIKIYHC